MRDGDKCSCGRIVSAHKIWGFSTSDFHTGGTNIVLPCFAIRKRNRRSCRSPFLGFGVFVIKNVFAPKPGFIYQIVLGIAYPRRSKNLCFVFGSARLLFSSFQDSRLYDRTIITSDARYCDRRMITVCITKRGIIVRSPKDILLGCMVFEQFYK